MATGCSNGNMRLYRALQISDTFCIPWQLVGMLRAHVGAVDLISLSGGSGKIATVNMSGSDACSCPHIWDYVSVMDEGCFILEDKIHFSDNINAINFQQLGNGLSLLGVCLPSKLCIYSQKQFSEWDSIKSEFSLKVQNWVCIAHVHTSLSIRSFMWGPRLSLVLLHEKYISIASQWSFATADECQADPYPEYFMDDSAGLSSMYVDGARSVAVFDHDIGSGSISPLIITRGKAGDIGLHNFRFIATGKSKRHQIPKERNVSLSRHLDANTGTSTKVDDNQNGYLWYLPRAHLGSITRISTVEVR